MANVVLAPYGTVPYNDCRLLVDPEVRVILPRQSHVSLSVQFRAFYYGLKNCGLHSEIRVRDNVDRARRISNRCMVPRSRRRGRFLEALVQNSPAH